MKDSVARSGSSPSVWVALKQVVIVSEPALEARLLDAVAKSGGKRMTVVSAHGKGLTGDGGADVSGELIRIDCFCTEEVAEAIARALQNRFFGKYDVFVAMADAKVLRPDKF